MGTLEMQIDELKNIITNTKYFSDQLGTNFKIKLIEEKINQVFKVYTSNYTIFAKVSRRGWSKYEWSALNSLFKKGYLVPKPIYYIPIKTAVLNDWDFGNLKQENGIIFYFPIEGQNLLKNYNKDNLFSIFTLLHEFHKDNINTTYEIENYQETESQRGLKYCKYLNLGNTKNLIKKLKQYINLDIDLKLIHGDARPEHFIFNNGKIGMIDLEGMCIGDPFKDFGSLIAELYFYNFQINLQDYSIFLKLFERKLTENEILRLNFFIIRRLLVKLKYGKPGKSKDNVIETMENLSK